MKYLVVIEKAKKNFSAYVPDLPGCIATGITKEEVEVHIRQAIAMHLKGLREDGLKIPVPASDFTYIAKPGVANFLTAILTWMFSSYAIAPEHVYRCGNCGYETDQLPLSSEEEL